MGCVPPSSGTTKKAEHDVETTTTNKITLSRIARSGWWARTAFVVDHKAENDETIGVGLLEVHMPGDFYDKTSPY